MSERFCATCGSWLPNPKGRRKFCSDRCRKRQYDLACVDCGGRVDGTTPGKLVNPAEPVCANCAAGHYSTWPRDAVIEAIRLWALEHGRTPSAQDWQREKARGVDIPTLNHVAYRCGSWAEALRAAGLESRSSGPRGGFRPLTQAQRQECAARYAAGETSVQIAADLGCAPRIVLEWARRAGVPIRSGAFQREAAA